KDPLSIKDLKTLAAEIQQLLREDPQYLLLIYMDVVEFQNQHFAETFNEVPAQFRSLLGLNLEKVRQQSGWRGEDPAFVLASIYLYFFTYSGIETLYRGNRHLGVSDEQAAERFANLIAGGLWRSAPEKPDAPRSGPAMTIRQI